MELAEIVEIMMRGDRKTFLAGMRLLKHYHPDVYHQIMVGLQKIGKMN
jgi:hypothetical protein